MIFIGVADDKEWKIRIGIETVAVCAVNSIFERYDGDIATHDATEGTY